MTGRANDPTPLVGRYVAGTPTGDVHLRTVAAPPAGRDEPVLVLLHQSPLSSRRFEPLLTELGRWTAALAPDTPGYGESPRPRGEATVAGLAHTLWAAVDTLASGPVRLLGRATGAVIALQMAAAHPDRVAHLTLHGMPLYTPQEAVARLHDFAPPYVPDVDGTHLAWIWRRVCGEYPSADPEFITALVADYLAAGPDFATAYRAIWRFAGEGMEAALDAVEGAAVPTMLIAGGRDRIGYMHDRVRRRVPWATERVLPDATDFVAEQDPISFGKLLRETFRSAEQPVHAMVREGEEAWSTDL